MWQYQKETEGGVCLAVIFRDVLVIGMQTASGHFVCGRGEAPVAVSFCSWAAALKMLLCLGCCELSGAGRCLSKTVLSESSP